MVLGELGARVDEFDGGGLVVVFFCFFRGLEGVGGQIREGWEGGEKRRRKIIYFIFFKKKLTFLSGFRSFGFIES